MKEFVHKMLKSLAEEAKRWQGTGTPSEPSPHRSVHGDSSGKGNLYAQPIPQFGGIQARRGVQGVCVG
jgi:hypothetical protein